MASAHARRFGRSAALATVALALLVLAAPAGAQQTPDADSDACVMLLTADPPGIPGGKVVDAVDFTCAIARCLQHVADDPDKCHYQRGATLTLNCLPSSASARTTAAQIGRRALYRRLTTIGAPAWIRPFHHGVTVLLAAGKGVVVLNVGPTSDDDPSPSWTGARTSAVVGARRLVRWMGRNARDFCR